MHLRETTDPLIWPTVRNRPDEIVSAAVAVDGRAGGRILNHVDVILQGTVVYLPIAESKTLSGDLL